MFLGSPESCLSLLAEAHLVWIRFTDTILRATWA